MTTGNGNTNPAPSRTQPELPYPIYTNPATHGSTSLPPEVVLRLGDPPEQYKRHMRQLENDEVNGKIGKLNTALSGFIIDATEYCACYQVTPTSLTTLKTLNGEVIFQSHLYLFSILIAFEWEPSDKTIQRIQLALQKASNFLYDVTEGFMAIGQVIIGGPDLLSVADIQVMASNRFHPRAWNSALFIPEKYQPIRVGRGLWRKDQGFVVPWDESDSYRVFVHEWGHYAFGLVDEYLDLLQLARNNRSERFWNDTLIEGRLTPLPAQRGNSLYLAAPSIALPVDSIMSTLAASELIPRQQEGAARRAYVLGKIQETYPKVNPPQELEGPAELPIMELPRFFRAAPQPEADEVILSGDDMVAIRNILTTNPTRKLVGSCWVYIVKPNDSIIAQGVFSASDWGRGFTLLGAKVNDRVIIVAQTVQTDPQDVEIQNTIAIQVLSGTIGAERTVSTWINATPSTLPDFVDILPEAPGTDPEVIKYRVQLETTGVEPTIIVSALGDDPSTLSWLTTRDAIVYPDGVVRQRLISNIGNAHHLDGHVLLKWDSNALYICGFSHGGGPCTSGGGRCVCYTAGSYEGNSMIFYLGNLDAADTEDNNLRLPSLPIIGDEGGRIVSTVLTGGVQYLSRVSGPKAEARSYIFSLASNQPLQTDSATLVLYYDYDALKQDGDLLIYRWHEADGWQPITTCAPQNQPYLCMPLDKAVPETSSLEQGRYGHYVDRYRIYWTPH